MQQRITPKSLIAENKRRYYCRVRNHLKVILYDRSIQEFVVKLHEAILSIRSILEFVLE